jgi:hypothetical protein
MTQMVNHFEGHHEITTKNKLFKNIAAYRQDVFKSMLPLTFCIKIKVDGSIDNKMLDKQLKPFK